MSQNILDEIEPSYNQNSKEIEEKANSFLAKTKKMAIVAAISLLVFLLVFLAEMFRISTLRMLFPLVILCGIVLAITAVLSLTNAYCYGEQASILSFNIDKNRASNQNFNRFVYGVLFFILLIVAWKIFKSYDPKELVMAQFDGNEEIEVTARWWRPYRHFITLLFLITVPLASSGIILFLCLHTHEKTLSLQNQERIYELKLKYLLIYLSLMVLTMVGILIIENNYPLRRYYRSIARLVDLSRGEISVFLISFSIILFISQWFVYMRKPQHL